MNEQEIRKELEVDPDATLFERSDVEALLEVIDRTRERAAAAETEAQALDQILTEVKRVAREFLDASNWAAAKQLTPAQAAKAAQKWVEAGSRLRALVGTGIKVVRGVDGDS